MFLFAIGFFAKAQEFLDLVLGSLTVVQYAAKFVELSPFAPCLVPNEELKAQKFKKGLHPRILGCVVGFVLSNLVDLINKASVIERTWKANTEFFS